MAFYRKFYRFHRIALSGEVVCEGDLSNKSNPQMRKTDYKSDDDDDDDTGIIHVRKLTKLFV